jgi:hypothetical protein
MRQKSGINEASAKQIIKGISHAIRERHSAGAKIRIGDEE